MVYEQVATLTSYGNDNKYTVQSGASAYDKTTKFMQSETRKDEKDKYENEKSKYGVWGSTFKNQQHFAGMHHC